MLLIIIGVGNIGSRPKTTEIYPVPCVKMNQRGKYLEEKVINPFLLRIQSSWNDQQIQGLGLKRSMGSGRGVTGSSG